MIDSAVSLGLNLSTLVTVVVMLTVLLLLKTWTQRPVNMPPTPTFAFPILGHLPFLRKGPLEKLNEWRQSVGGIYSIYMGSQLYVVISSYELLKEVFVKHADKTSDRPKTMIQDSIPGFRTGIAAASGHHWKENRTASMAILRAFGMGKNMLAEKISEEIKMYLISLEELGGKAANIHTLTSMSVSNVVCAILIGKRFEFTNKTLEKLLDLLNEYGSTFASLNLMNIFPWVRFLPGDMFKAKRVIEIVNSMETLLSEHFVNQFLDTYEDSEKDNFIIAYLKEMKRKVKDGEQTELTVDTLHRVMNNLFVGGSETTSTTIQWALLYMIHYPDIQDKVYKEIADNVGTDSPVDMRDRSSLNFLNATIMETQRLGSIVPMSLPHMCTEDIQVAGYTIPKDAVLVPFLDAVLKDERTWPDPLAFKPERFLDSNGRLTVPNEFLPFSLGRRVCMAEAMANTELFLYLSNILQRFQVLPEDPNKLPTLEATSGIVRAPQEYNVVLRKRN